MARKSKKKVIEELSNRSIEFDPDMKYAELCELLKKPPEKEKIDVRIVDAARKCGLSNEQIGAYESEESLLDMIHQLKPLIWEKVRPKPETPLVLDAPRIVEPVLRIFNLVITRPAERYQNARRANVEDNELYSTLRARGIQESKIVKIVIEQDFVPKKGNLETNITVTYKE